MPGVARVGLDRAGGAQLGGGQDWVRTDGALDVVRGDAVTPHGPDPHAAAVMVGASSWDFIGGIPVCRAGDRASCGHASTGSDWVTSSD